MLNFARPHHLLDPLSNQGMLERSNLQVNIPVLFSAFDSPVASVHEIIFFKVKKRAIQSVVQTKTQSAFPKADASAF